MKKLLAVLLTLAMCIPCFGAISFPASAALSEHVYMIITNPGENMDTQMNIGWHADFTYTNCSVEYTTADDTDFSDAVSVNGTYDDDDYKWFMDRSTTIAIGPEYFNTPFLNYGVELSGLAPDTDYIYRICDGEGAYSETYAFKTAGQDEFSILWTSDMHLSNETTATETSKRNKFKAVVDFLLPQAEYEVGLHFNTGDVVASGDRYGFWQAYYDMDVMKNYTYAATVGNHDLFDSMMDDDPNYTSFWASSEYFRIVSNYPENGYTQTSGRIGNYLTQTEYTQYANSPANELFTVDSGRLAGKKITGSAEDTNGRAYWFIYNKILFIVFDYYAMTYNSEIGNAFNWAYDVIEQNKGKYDYLVATEHLNLFWGDGGNDRYYNRYEDFLNKANVDLFFCGDNHIYFRTDSLVEGAVNTDPEKGTYILQAAAITNTSTYPLYTGAVGAGVNRYSSADYLGGAMINVDSEGMHFTVAVGTGDGSDLAVYDTFTIPKKVRYADATPGIYELGSDLTVYETSDVNSTVLYTLPAGSLVEVYQADGIWGKVRANGMSGWARISDAECLYAMDEPSVYDTIPLTGGYNMKYSAAGIYAYTPEYGATIANGGWSFAYNYTFIATEQADGSYVITETNTETGVAKNTTPTSDTTVVIMMDNTTGDTYTQTLVVGYQFTLDWAQATLNAVDKDEEAADYVLHEVTYYGYNGAYLGKNYVLDGHAANALTAPDVDGYVFTGWDKDISAVTADITVNAVYKEDAVLGDVNDDGEIDSLDAAAVLKYDAGILRDIADCADVNGDGEIDSLDAAAILKYDAGIITEF